MCIRDRAAGDASSLGFASSYLETKATNLEAARSRVMDADIVEESTNLSLYTIQYEASVAALSLIHISEPTRRRGISYAVFCLKKKKRKEKEEVRRGGGGGGGVFFFF